MDGELKRMRSSQLHNFQLKQLKRTKEEGQPPNRFEPMTFVIPEQAIFIFWDQTGPTLQWRVRREKYSNACHTSLVF